MTLVQLGTITDEKLARCIDSAMELYSLSWALKEKDGKATLEVFADVDEADARLLEAMR